MKDVSSGGSSAVISSRKPMVQDGSNPITRAPRSTKGLKASSVRLARGEIGPAAAHGAAAARCRLDPVKPIARSDQDAHRRIQGSGFEIAVERVAEQDKVASVPKHILGPGDAVRFLPWAAPFRQAALRRDGQPQRIRPAPRHVPFVQRRPIGRAHGPARQCLAGAVVVAHLDGRTETAPIQRGLARLGGGMAGLEPHQAAVVHLQRPDDFLGFRRFRGSNSSLTASKARVSLAPDIGTTNSDREMPPPCSPEKEPLYFLTKSAVSSAMARILRTPSSSFMFRQASRTSRTGFWRRLDHLDHRVREAMVRHALVKPLQIALQGVGIVAGEFHQKQAVQGAPGDIAKRLD